MKNTVKTLFMFAAGCNVETPSLQQPITRELGDTIELASAKLIIEHNATDEDTGFQGFVDGEPWRQLQLRDPEGRTNLEINARGELRELGLTELFFETNEPPNDEVPIEDLLERMPEGEYAFRARTVEGAVALGVATLTHAIPAGPEIVQPAAAAVVDAGTDLVFAWKPSTEPECDDDLAITHYQLIVSVRDQPDHPGFGAETFDVRVPASLTSLRVPHEFLRPGTEYEFEVLAIAHNGNQTITAGEFTTL
jgi:hypothetical protein